MGICFSSDAWDSDDKEKKKVEVWNLANRNELGFCLNSCNFLGGMCKCKRS